MPDVPRVLFLCVHNAGRSQMATGVRPVRDEIRRRVVELLGSLGVAAG
ncbi:MAG: hypothetical protein QOG43_3431 [Actinomycetota bacterium]|jgi:protein-tyrosine-phosphatase|nr:hypothetical protein [Actinomycetota bacterium]